MSLMDELRRLARPYEDEEDYEEGYEEDAYPEGEIEFEEVDDTEE